VIRQPPVQCAALAALAATQSLSPCLSYVLI